MTTKTFADTMGVLDDLHDRFRAMRGEMALLSMLAIAQKTRDVCPDAAYLALDDSDQEGCWKTPAGFYTADGQELPDPADHALEDALCSLCDNFSDPVRAVWEPFTADVGGRTCLDLAAALRITRAGAP